MALVAFILIQCRYLQIVTNVYFSFYLYMFITAIIIYWDFNFYLLWMIKLFSGKIFFQTWDKKWTYITQAFGWKWCIWRHWRWWFIKLYRAFFLFWNFNHESLVVLQVVNFWLSWLFKIQTNWVFLMFFF